MSQLETRDYYLVAALLHQRIKPLKPLEDPVERVLWQEYRALSAKLAGLFEDDAAGHVQFDPLTFISYAMTGAPA